MRPLFPSDATAVYVQSDAYSVFAAQGTVRVASHGRYLIESSRYDSATVLASLEAVTP